MLRCDIRPPLLEVFFFDEYTNLYVNGGKTDFVWDYSRWAEQAFREYLKKLPPRNAIPSGIPDESVPLYLQRLEYYRRLYRPKQVEGQ